MYDYQQEPDLDSIPTMGDYFDRVDAAWSNSDLERALQLELLQPP